MKHLSDEQIQRYLDGDMSLDSEAAYHLQECPICQRQLQLYRKVYEGLQQDTGFELAPSFAETVITRLTTVPSKSSRTGLAGLIFIGFGIAAVACLTLYFLEAKTLTEMLASLFAVATGFGLPLVESFKAVIASMGVRPDIVLFTILILITFGAIDRILLRYRWSHLCL